MWGNSEFRQLEQNRSTIANQHIISDYKSYSPNYNWKTTTRSPLPPTNSYTSYYNTIRASPQPPPPPTPPPKATADIHRVVPFHSSSSWRSYFHSSKTTNKLIVVDFTATWCGPCRKMEPVIDEFAANYTDVDFAKIDVDNLFDISSEYGVQVMPTFLLMRNGKVVDKVTGTRKDELQRKILKYRV